MKPYYDWYHILSYIKKRHKYHHFTLLTITVYNCYLTTAVGVEYGTFHTQFIHLCVCVCLLFGLFYSSIAVKEFTWFLLH